MHKHFIKNNNKCACIFEFNFFVVRSNHLHLKVPVNSLEFLKDLMEFVSVYCLFVLAFAKNNHQTFKILFISAI